MRRTIPRRMFVLLLKYFFCFYLRVYVDSRKDMLSTAGEDVDDLHLVAVGRETRDVLGHGDLAHASHARATQHARRIIALDVQPAGLEQEEDRRPRRVAPNHRLDDLLAAKDRAAVDLVGEMGQSRTPNPDVADVGDAERPGIARRDRGDSWRASSAPGPDAVGDLHRPR